MSHQPFPFRKIWKAKERIRGIIDYTPLLYSEPLSKESGTNVYLKLENLQPTGAFKIRGAANKILSLSSEDQHKGVATFSTGNHGIAVAYVAKRLGIPSTVCLSNRVPKGKVERLKRLDAHVELIGSNQDDAEAYCYQLEEESGVTVVKPFDDPDVIAGQGTIGLEVLEQCPDVDRLIIPLSGGGLLSGISYALKSIDSAIHITGVSMEASAVMYESLKKGYPITMEEQDTLADSLLGGLGPNNRYTFPMTKAYMDEGVLVSEEAIAEGILFMLKHHKMAIEGAAAAGIGRLISEEAKEHRHIVLVVSGNNIDHHTLRDLIKKDRV